MLFKRFEEFCQLILAAIDGVYGWISETVSLIIIVIVFNFLAKWVLNRLHQRFEKQNKFWHDSFVRALGKPLGFYVWFFAAVHILDLIAYRSFPQASIENMHMLLEIAGVFCLSWFLFRWKKNVVQYLSMMSKNHTIAIDQSKIDVMDKLVTLLILFVSILLLMEASERSMNTLIAFGGVGGLAIAFASQEVISNFFGGIMIYATHPFAKGDWIHIPDRNIEGNVEEIGWYMTRVRSLDKRPIYVPNSIFSKVVVITPSRMTHRRIKETIGLRYCDMPVLKCVINDISQWLKQHPDIDHAHPVIVNFDSFGSYSLDVLVQAHLKILDTEGFAKAKDEILFKIADIVANHKAEMAYPSTNIFLSKD